MFHRTSMLNRMMRVWLYCTPIWVLLISKIYLLSFCAKILPKWTSKILQKPLQMHKISSQVFRSFPYPVIFPNCHSFVKSQRSLLTFGIWYFSLNAIFYISCSRHRTTNFPNSESWIFTTQFLFWFFIDSENTFWGFFEI